MSSNQIACRMAHYHRMLHLFADQPDLAPINVCHFNILQNIFQFLLASTEDVKAICVIGDSIVALYDQHLDVIDLTVDEQEGGADAAEGAAQDPNPQADASNDSGLAD